MWGCMGQMYRFDLNSSGLPGILVFPCMFHEIGLHVLFLNVRDVSFSLLPSRIALVADGLSALHLLRAGARRLGQGAMVAGFSQAAIVLPLLRELRFCRRKFFFDFGEQGSG